MTPPPYAGGTVGARALRRFAAWTVRRDLATHYRRCVRAGALPSDDPAPGRPLVVYANHHIYHDSYVLLHWLTRHLHRPIVVWMAAWDRAPLFGPLGALPFPAGDARGRAATVRDTARRMASDPRTALILYPEGAMHPPEHGLAPFRADLPRLARLLPETTAWVPAGIHATWWGESRPTLVLATGDVHGAPEPAPAPAGGDEPRRLADALGAARAARPADLAQGRAFCLLDGARGPDERWDLSRLAPLARRWT